MFTIYRRVLFYRWWTPVTACEIVPMGILPNSDEVLRTVD